MVVQRFREPIGKLCEYKIGFNPYIIYHISHRSATISPFKRWNQYTGFQPLTDLRVPSKAMHHILPSFGVSSGNFQVDAHAPESH